MNAGMDWLALIGGGLVIGLLVAAPIGPVNLICIRRTLSACQNPRCAATFNIGGPICASVCTVLAPPA